MLPPSEIDIDIDYDLNQNVQNSNPKYIRRALFGNLTKGRIFICLWKEKNHGGIWAGPCRKGEVLPGGLPRRASVKRALLQLRHDRSESFGGMGKVYFGCDMEFVEEGTKAGQMS